MVAFSMESAVLMEMENSRRKFLCTLYVELNTFEEKTMGISHRINFVAHSVLENN